jgi:YHS domain-containing protein
VIRSKIVIRSIDPFRFQEVAVATDPVCRMQIDESKAAGKSEYNGKTYYFCAPVCKRKFDENPQKYVNQ